MYVFWPLTLSLTATYAIASLSFPPATEMFHFAGFASLSGCSPLGLRVAPFGYPRLYGYLLLIVAFRSLSRPSSLSTTKAFTNCPYYLNYYSTSLNNLGVFCFAKTPYFFIRSLMCFSRTLLLHKNDRQTTFASFIQIKTMPIVLILFLLL